MDDNQGSNLKKQTPQERKRGAAMKRLSRFSPMYVFRTCRDCYVNGCLTAGNSAQVRGAAHAVGFQAFDDEIFTRSPSRPSNNVVASEEQIFQLSNKFSFHGPVNSSPTIACHPGMTVADLLGYSGTICSKTYIDTVPELASFRDTSFTKKTLQHLFQTSPLHGSELICSRSQKLSVMESTSQLATLGRFHPSPNLVLARGGSERVRRSPSRFSPLSTNEQSLSTTTNSILNTNTPLNVPTSTEVQNFMTKSSPQTQVFKNQSQDTSLSDKPPNDNDLYKSFPKLSSEKSLSQKQDGMARLLSTGRHIWSPAQSSEDLDKSRSKKLNRPNPYREYDTRLTPPRTSAPR